MPTPITESQARQALQALLDDYNALSDDARAQMTEAGVVRQFVDRLLRDVLGWPIEDPQRYKYELSTQAGRPDITLIPEAGGTIFLEAKRFGAIKELAEARRTIAGVITPGQMALPGMAVDRTAEEQQAINYAFKNGGTWAILTNFEKLRLFNARRDWLVLSFESPSAYLDDFGWLWQLAYPNILNGSLDAISNQRHAKDVDTDYLNFINEWREILAQDIVQHRDRNPWAFHADGTINLSLLRAVVQRFLDRLVIVRFAEDHLVIPPGTLRDLYELRRRNPYTHSMDQLLDQFFRRFDEYHNSALFAPGPVDDAYFGDDALLQLIEKLYEARYRSMPADIIGNTYEQYLGKTLVLDDGSVTTRDNLETRKKQGSYYTPQVIVRYLVNTTLGRYLYGTADGRPDGEPVEGETRKTSRDIRTLRVLDSACGSGSFLIYAYNVLADFYESEIRRLQAELEARTLELAQQGVSPLERRLEVADYTAELDRIRDYPRLILETHLYGVDLDPQAAEIAVVNLMMRAMERRHQEKRLPLILNQNIKVGNALIGLRPDDPRLAEHADRLAAIRQLRLNLARSDHGPGHDQIIRDLEAATDALTAVLDQDFEPHFSDLARVRPFHWGAEFPEVFYDADGQPLENPGFTIIIGNPPWGAFLTKDEKKYLSTIFDLGTTDTAALMMIQSKNLLQQHGSHGFIVPKSFTFSSSWEKTRSGLFDGIRTLVDCGKVWKEVNLEQVIYLYVKGDYDRYLSLIFDGTEFRELGFINKTDCERFGFLLNGVSEKELALARKLVSSNNFFGDHALNTRGAALQSDIDEQATSGKFVLAGKNVQPFEIKGTRGRLKPGVEIPKNAIVKPNSILAQNIVAHITRPTDHIKIIAALVDPVQAADLVILDTVNQITPTGTLSREFLLGILSSRLINWFVYRFIFAKAIRTMHFDSPVTSRIPLPKIDFDNKRFSSLYEQVCDAVTELSRTQEESTRKEIQALLDNVVYELYEVTEDELQLIPKL